MRESKFALWIMASLIPRPYAVGTIPNFSYSYSAAIARGLIIVFETLTSLGTRLAIITLCVYLLGKHGDTSGSPK